VKKQKPIVLLKLIGTGQHFTFEDAFALLDDLEGNMPARNPYCLDELRSRLGGMPLSEFQEVIRAALEQASSRRRLVRTGGHAHARRVPHLNINGTSNQLEAELIDLVECLAAATGRTCEWKGGLRLADALQQEHSLDSLSSPRRFCRGLVHACSPRSAGSHVAILHEPDAAADAARLQDGMQRTIGQRCDGSIPTTVEAMVHRLEKQVASSPYVLLLQTRGVLYQPWALLAAYRAALAGKSMACVVVSGSGYDFGGAKHHLETLSERLDAASLEQIVNVLSQFSPPRHLPALQRTLATLIPHIISVVYHPQGSDNELAATVHDIRDKQSLLARGKSGRGLIRQLTIVTRRTSSDEQTSALGQGRFGRWAKTMAETSR
jgi:hypothetical protein